MRKSIYIILIVLISCAIMGYVDGILQPQYFTKSMIKICLFFSLPIMFYIFSKQSSIKTLFTLTKQSFFFALVIGITLYIIIISGYFIAQNFIDFSQITTQLSNNIGVNASNFIFVALYISIINSFLEEFFFRGFSFITLQQFTTKKFAYLFSSVTFALYHVAMMIGWFSVPIYIVAVLALILTGVFLNWLNDKFKSIYVSWIVHFFANLGINTVGFILFGVL